MNIVQAYEHFGYPSPEKLYLLLQKKIPLSRIKEKLSDQVVRQLYYRKPNRSDGHILALAPLQRIEIDLCFMDKFGKHNNGYLYILLAIDVFSRYAWAVPLKTKKSTSKDLGDLSSEVAVAYKQIPISNNVISDNGGEFKGEFSELMRRRNTAHTAVLKNDHNALGIVDRFTLTLKNMLYKGFVANNDVYWIGRLDEIIHTYNNTPNIGIYNYTPEQAYNNKNVQIVLATINSELLKNVGSEINIGDHVRVRVQGGIFERGYVSKWSSEIFQVVEKEGNTYTLSDGKHVKLINLQKVPEGESGGGEELAVATKEHQSKRRLQKENIGSHLTPGVKDIVAKEKRVRVIKFDKSLVGRLIDRGNGETGKIVQYDPEGDYKWFVKYDKKANLKHEWMDANEVQQFLVV